jgi:outer membrane murein-binding lipoprotein Lpp
MVEESGLAVLVAVHRWLAQTWCRTRKEDAVEARKTTLTAVFLGMITLAGCKGGGDEGMTGRLKEANDKVVACRSEVNELKTQNADLKRKLAEAMANPSRVQLTDPDILNLIAEIKSKNGAPRENGDVVLGKGALNPKEASRVVKQGAQALQKCYERALKKSSALQMQSGLGVMLELTVKPTGLVQGMNLSPQVDADLTDCVRTTVARWKFPPFAGESVVVTQKLTLTPKT